MDFIRTPRHRIITVAIVSSVMIGLAGFAAYAWMEKREAETWRRIALSRQLAAQADKLTEDKLDLALLLSVEACRAAKTLEGRSALLTALRKEPLLKSMLHGHTRSINTVAFSPDGNTLASAGFFGDIILWDPHTYQAIDQSLQEPKGLSLHSVAFSPDGKTLAAGGDKTIMLWDLKTCKPLGPPLEGHQDAVRSVAISPDGKILASGSEDDTIIFWDLEARKPVGPPLKVHQREVRSVAFSPDGQTLASGSDNDALRLWDVKSIQPAGTPPTGHTDSVQSLACSPDGKVLASGSADQTIILWDVKT